MQTHALRERQRWTHEPWAIFPKLFVDGSRWVARMNVDGDIELGAGLPEWIPNFAVVEDHIVPVGTGSLGVIDQGSFEAVFGYGTAELGCCFVGVMH